MIPTQSYLKDLQKNYNSCSICKHKNHKPKIILVMEEGKWAMEEGKMEGVDISRNDVIQEMRAGGMKE